MNEWKRVTEMDVSTLRAQYGSPITCPYCREPYKEYEKYPGCCSSCHAPPNVDACLAEIWKGSPVPADVYLYFKKPEVIERNYSNMEVVKAYSQPRYQWINDEYREL